jgi:N-acetylglucosamine-6-phosphate deacetylase
MKLLGHIVTPSAVVPGVVGFDARVRSVRAAAGAPDRFILPGFIDCHVHGGGGGDAMDGAAGIQTMTRFHLEHGTTALLATTITRPWKEIIAALRAIAEQIDERSSDRAAVLGAHMEGPFINPARLGAQPPFAIPPAPRLIAEALATGAVRVATLAPEIPGGAQAASALVRAGVRVSLGHSAATYELATEVIESRAQAGGMVGGTHLFNAMGGLEGRTPGLVGALLASRTAHAELILDLLHVHPGSVRAAYAAIGDRLFAITDAMRATGLGDCESELGGQKVTVRDGAARLADGGLAGSLLTMDAAFRNALAIGFTLQQASRLTSANAARWLGLTDRGALTVGARADLVVMDSAMRVSEVWTGGVRRL